jgi:hypothetical protein
MQKHYFSKKEINLYTNSVAIFRLCVFKKCISAI